MLKSCPLAVIFLAVSAVFPMFALGQADPASAVQDLEVVAQADRDVAETHIRFRIGPDALDEGPVRATIRIYSGLGQVLAIARSLNHDENPPVDRLPYGSAGVYEASWDGSDGSGRPVPSGVYYVEVILEGSTPVRQRFELMRRAVEL